MLAASVRQPLSSGTIEAAQQLRPTGQAEADGRDQSAAGAAVFAITSVTINRPDRSPENASVLARYVAILRAGYPRLIQPEGAGRRGAS